MVLISQRMCARCNAANAPEAMFCSSCASSLKITLPLSATSETAVPYAILAHLNAGDLLEKRYRIVSQVGTGGFGAVYKAEDTQDHNRLLAIKEIGLGGLTSQQIIEATGSFNREVDLLSDLRHASIPRIYAHLTDPEHWYLVMDFIEGETLEDHRLRQASACLALEETLRIGIQLCAVLDYLHSHQPPIIYRDVKPSNVMLTPKNHLYLIDYGVARYFRAGKSRDTIAFGSPGFAPPEQYGKAQTTPRSDIYSLGVTLYQLLTGIDPSLSPFRFPALRVLDASIPPELESLVTQMLEMDAEKRPASMSIVKQRLQHLLDQCESRPKPGQATRPSSAKSAPDPRSVSSRGLTRYIHRAHDKAVHTLAWSPDGKRIASSGEDNFAQVWDAFDGGNLFVYQNHVDVVHSVSWSPDGRRIATASRDQTVHVWDAVSGPRWLRAAALLVGFRYTTFEGHTAGVNTVAWSPDGTCIASAGADHRVLVWEATSRKILTSFQAHTDTVLFVAWSPDSRLLASTSIDHTTRIWEARTKDGSFTYRDSHSLVHDMSWSPGGQHIALASSDHMVHIWDALSHRKIYTYQGHTGRVLSVAWSPDGTYIASGGNDQSVHIWKAVHKKVPVEVKPLFVYNQHSGPIWSVAWSPDGQHIASAGDDGTVYVWQAV